MNVELEKFLDEVVKEYNDMLTMSYSYVIHNSVGKINVGQGIFDEIMKGKAFPPGVTTDTIFHNGVHVVLDKNLSDNVVETFKRNYYQGSLGGKPPIHSCYINTKRYIGFTRVFDYCTVCDVIIKEIKY